MNAPQRLSQFCDIVSGVGAMAAGGGVLAFAAAALQAAAGAAGLAEALDRRGDPEAAAALARFRRRAERDWRSWAAVEGASAGDLDAALADFDALLAETGPSLAPAPARLAAVRREAAVAAPDDPPAEAARRLAGLIVDAAAARASELYEDRPDRAFSRRVLRGLAAGAFAALFADPAFEERMRPALTDLLLASGARIEAEQARQRDLISAEGERTRAAVAALGDDLRAALSRVLPPGLSLGQAEAILARFGEREVVEDPDRIALLLERKAEELHKLQRRLRDLSGELPRVAELRLEAAGLIGRGDFDGAEAALLAARRLDHAMRIELDRRRDRAAASEADTLGRLADLARLRCRWREAAELWRRAAEMTPEADVEGRCRRILAGAAALAELGRERGELPALAEAIAIVESEALPLAPRAARPLDWARAQAELGNALVSLGEREGDPERLAAAAAAYRAALLERTRAAAPADWAATLTNLGHALTALGALEHAPAPLEEAVATYREALSSDALADPLARAAALNNLGNAFKALGQRREGAARVRDAVEAYRAALAIYTPDRYPYDRAMTLSNLAAALRTLAARENDPAPLEEAIAAYRDALAVRTRERAPLDWAATETNLANALQTLAALADDRAPLIEAIGRYRAALEVRTAERAPLDRALTAGNLGVALLALAEADRADSHAAEAEAEIAGALAALTAAGAHRYADYYAGRLAEARALREDLRATV